MTFIKRLMEIKEEQLKAELRREWLLQQILNTLKKGQFMFLKEVKVLKGRKDGKRKINRKN